MKTNVPANIVRTIPIAMHAVAQHMLDFDLPAPYSIDGPKPCQGRGHITIAVPSTALTQWLDTVVVEDETTKAATVPGWTHTRFAGRLPVGVRVEIHVTRKGHTLRSVTP